MSRKILVAGIGNVFLGDDGFGVEVAKRLAGSDLPAGVAVADFGIRGVHLAYQLLDGYDTLVLIDAARRGEPPGTIFVLERNFGAGHHGGPVANGFDSHGMNPEVVLATLERLGGTLRRVLIVGCEPETIEEAMALSDPVGRAVPEAVRLVLELVWRESSISDRG
jgi:hydrogenase maturation protease